jgi:hypothetical protein
VPHLSFAAWSLLHGATTLFLDGLLRLQIPDLAARPALEAWVQQALVSLVGGQGRRP